MKNPQDDGLVITMMISRSAEAGALPDPEPVADPNPEADAHYGYYGYGEDDHDALWILWHNNDDIDHLGCYCYGDEDVRMILTKMLEDYFVKTFFPGGWHSPYYGYAWPYYHGYYWG